MKKIGFIGVGIMGKSMVKNLMKAGFELHIYARTKSKVDDVIEEGAIFHETIGECVRASEAVITMVGFPQDVEEVYFDEGNIMDQAEKGMYLIDMTTTSPMISKKIYEEGKKKGVHVVDAPVTGGDTGAKAGTLSILVGGNKEDYEACMPLFEAMGTNINYQGEAGCGQHAKMVNQIMIAGTMSGLCEALSYAKAKDLDCETVLKSVATGAAGSKQLDFFGEKILHGVVTFIRSTLFTVSLSVRYTPAFSRAGLPFGNLSSITRYCGPSAFTNGAIYVFLKVITGSIFSIPSSFKDSHTLSAGLGVILSIIDHGNDT